MDQELEPRPRKAIVIALSEYLDDHYPCWEGDPSKIPSGLQLEMHPFTQQMLIRDPDREFAMPGRVSARVHIPTKINLDLKPGQWRLVEVATDVKTGGMLP